MTPNKQTLLINTITDLTQLKTTKGTVERTLNIMEFVKGDAKGQKYVGIDIAENNLDEVVKFLGTDIVSSALHTAINTKLIKFNETAFETCIKAHKDDTGKQKECFINELKAMVKDWSMREESKAKLQEKMLAVMMQLVTKKNKDTGEDLTPEDIARITLEVNEMSAKLATK